MSAFLVSKTHIDALLYAGLRLPGQRGPLCWRVRDLTEADKRDAYERGQMWGERAIELWQELKRELTTENLGPRGGDAVGRKHALGQPPL